MVLILFERKDERYDHLLMYCFPGDKQRRTQKVARDMVDIQDVMSIWCFKDKFYVMCVGDRHLEIERQQLGDITSFSVRPIEVADTTLWTSVGGTDTHTTVSSLQFVECGDELFKIVIIYPARGYDRVDIALFVAKYDFSVMELKEVDSFGDHNEDQREAKDGGELQEAIPWDILNEDLVGLIANYLHRLDCIHFRLVSKANRAVMPMVKLTASCTTRCMYLSPWLVFSRNKFQDVYNFVNPMHNKENYLMNLSDILGATIRFQKGGWLLMSKGFNSVFFYNPFTKENINLPDLPVDMYSFSGISFSSSPTSSDCMVFAIQQMRAGDGMSNEISIYFIKRGAALWSIFNSQNMSTEKFMPLHNTPVFHNGAFYCLDYNGKLGVFSLEDSNWKVLEKPHQQFSGIYPSFLVECAG
ncbi:F-box/kelch-repeat protein At1g57790-like [Papaver somniferum]|uniref:F-box/kelch-repeat protein At1g57790-like n=1 Tax=Papaver somniferum TaxID=3469 RepID=UPI000E6FDD56|nr:F-box/kelch-repeat protein At1g57790-like [Papaver somniferum]